jgi:hypothetical protein
VETERQPLEEEVRLGIILTFAAKHWWTPPPVTIENKAELAIVRTEKSTPTLTPLAIYRDGSGIHGKRGGHDGFMGTRAQAYLGKETTSMLYAVELAGR